jgi:DNA-directed RNA polymerase sigma subunit (sigma70/sigma32)
MNISLVTLTLAAPVVGLPKRRQKSHTSDYRRLYVARVNARERQHGALNRKRKGDLMAGLSLRSATEVARILGISKEAVRQIENRAMSKLRNALLPFYGELNH